MNAPSSAPLLRSARLWLGIVVSPLVLGFIWVLLGQPGTGGVLDYRKAADGTECLVTQSWNDWFNGGEAYTIGFYTRRPGKDWSWQYIDHEAGRWHNCRVEIEEAMNEVRVYRGDKLQRTLRLHPAPPFETPARPPYLPEETKAFTLITR